jgi:hypothetical protein
VTTSRSDRSQHKGSGFVGHPAIIFWMMNDYGKSSHMGNLVILDKWRSQLAAHLGVTLDPEEYERDYRPHLDVLNQYISETWEMYHPSMEGLDRFNPTELVFVAHCRYVYDWLTLYTARSHICDKIEYDREESHEVE